MKYVLGIDLGTTSVKVSVVDADTKRLVEHQAKATNSEAPSSAPGAREQHVPTIISALNICLSKLDADARRRVAEIGVCGQMHGVVFWTADESRRPWQFQGKTYRIDDGAVSNLHTWQDGRCSPRFLALLPKPDSHLGVSAGFGVPTMFWLLKNSPGFFKKYTKCGPISSFVVAMLTDQVHPYTSEQNAASWGYFNCRTSAWNLKLLEKYGLPVDMLPKVKPAGEIVGVLKERWHGLPDGIPIGVDMGDLQCSVLSTLTSDTDAVLNISTSAQMAFVAKKYIPPAGVPVVNPISYWPFFRNQFVAVAASLNGGNVLAMFVDTLKGWLADVGEPIDDDAVWTRLIAVAKTDNTKPELEIKPTCLGERFAPNLLGSVRNITADNVELGHVFRALCKGLVANLHSMMPARVLIEANVDRIVGNGGGLFRNEVLQEEVEKIYQLPLVFEQEGDAARGAALAMIDFERNSCCSNWPQ
ncbi:unnamed protein product [Phyllotreta striolata]|uniref:Sedoheptulokinase n=1 Tax=Phyllotreta striolata TaxID=444603 RepID=A0A9N9TT55_PHYSR|nr:unnamed protein product [Phyllotreta striolata]